MLHFQCICTISLSIVNLCPSTHPHPYLDGQYCCKTDQEKTGESHAIPETCDGGKLGYSSVCCNNDEYAICPNVPCSCVGECETGYGPGPCKDFSRIAVVYPSII